MSRGTMSRGTVSRAITSRAITSRGLRIVVVAAMLLIPSGPPGSPPELASGTRPLPGNSAEPESALTARDVRAIVSSHVGLTQRGWRGACRHHAGAARLDWVSGERRRLVAEEAAQHGAVSARMRREALESARVTWLVRDVACHGGDIAVGGSTTGHFRTADGRRGVFHPSVR